MITLATWNLQGMAAGWRARRSVLVGELRAHEVQVVALQECAYRLRHQSVQVAGPLGMRAVRAGTLGLASALPVGSVERAMLPQRGKRGSKRVLKVQVLSDGVRVHVWNVHLPLTRAVRLQSAQRFADQARAIREDDVLVICGDFNEPPDGPAVSHLREAGFTDAWLALYPHEPGLTWPLPEPRARVDYVFVRGPARVARAELLGTRAPASDHLGLLVELTTEREAAASAANPR